MFSQLRVIVDEKSSQSWVSITIAHIDFKLILNKTV